LSRPTEPVLASWSRDDVFDFAVRRGTQLRRRRLALQSAVTVAAVIVVALPLGLMFKDAESASRLHTVDQPTVTLSDDAGPAAETGPSEHLPAGGGAPTSPAAPTARGANLPVVKPTTTTTPAAAVQPAPCDLSEVELHTATDKPQYLTGEHVIVTARIRNVGARACARPVQTDLTISHDTGGQVFAATEPGGDGTWRPNEEIVVSFDWDQRCSNGCTLGTANRGSYTANASWTSGRGAWAKSASFTI
jgi:hypothetical protein